MKGKKISTLNLLLIIQLVIMIVLSVLITATMTKTTKKNSIEHMQTITDERAQIILNYVKNAEKTLTYYSKAEQVVNLLSDPDNPKYIEKAQKFTEDYSKDVENIEGIWIGTWETKCIAHTNPKTVGMVTRPKDKVPEKLKQLQDDMLAAGDGVYNTGMILSPATSKQIVSMYKAVYDSKGEPMGFVGLGIFTNKLIESLNELSIKGVENSFYSMVNVNDGTYVFNDNEELVYKVAENEKIKELCKKYQGTTKAADGSFEYTKDGKKYVSIYSYIPEYGWILMLDDTRSEVYSLTKDLRVYMIIFALVLIGLMILFSFIARKQQKVSEKLAASIVKNNKTKESLYTAMFKDVLTDVNNRISFSMDIDELKSTNKNPYYFAMFNISDFSQINSQHGNDTGDWLLVRTVDILKQVFKSGKIYRTGSDEFVVAIPQSNADVTKESIMENVEDAYRRLTAKQNTPIGKLNFVYKAAVVKKNKDLNTAVVSALKDMTTSNPAQMGYAEL